MTGVKEKISDILAVIIVWIMLRWDDIKDTIVTILVTLLVCFMITNFFFRPVIVSGISSYPNLKNGSVGFSSIVSRTVPGIRRFDLVVVYREDRKDSLIKRVIGLPGETVRYTDDKLYINDQYVEEPFLDREYVKSELQRTGKTQFTADFTYVLGEDEYFCMGDNRIVSADSRVYGPFHNKDLVASGLFILYPFSEFGIKK